MIQQSLHKVMEKQDLTRQEAFATMNTIMEGKATSAQIGAFLVAMRMKGETPEEIAGFALSMREKAAKVVAVQSDSTVDLVGTGGDGKHTFNISTVASFVVAGANVPVAKHGNRSVSSKCGSADVLSALGINMDLDAQKLSQCLGEVGIAFLFAPMLHPAMKHAIGPRRELGIRSVFNILGPITNPADVKRQLVGVFNLEVAGLLAEVLQQLDAHHVLLVHSEDGLDEISLQGYTHIIEVKDGKIREDQVDAATFGLEPATDGITGGDPKLNAAIATSILSGEKSPARNVVIANAAAGLYVANRASDFKQAAEMAAESIDTGAAFSRLQAMRDFSQQFSKK